MRSAISDIGGHDGWKHDALLKSTSDEGYNTESLASRHETGVFSDEMKNTETDWHMEMELGL